jgi:hypothetical protein
LGQRRPNKLFEQRAAKTPYLFPLKPAYSMKE